MRLSSKITRLSQVLCIVLGLPISMVIAVETQYALWAIALSIALALFSVYFAAMAAELFLENEQLVFQKIFQSKIPVIKTEIEGLKHFRSKKHNYFWFTTKKGSFLVIAPMWGEAKDSLFKLHSEFNSPKEVER